MVSLLLGKHRFEPTPNSSNCRLSLQGKMTGPCVTCIARKPECRPAVSPQYSGRRIKVDLRLLKGGYEGLGQFPDGCRLIGVGELAGIIKRLEGTRNSHVIVEYGDLDVAEDGSDMH